MNICGSTVAYWFLCNMNLDEIFSLIEWMRTDKLI